MRKIAVVLALLLIFAGGVGKTVNAFPESCIDAKDASCEYAQYGEYVEGETYKNAFQETLRGRFARKVVPVEVVFLWISGILPAPTSNDFLACS